MQIKHSNSTFSKVLDHCSLQLTISFLPALGEIVVYVDGMQGMIQCNEIIQWLYQLSTSKV